MKITLTVGCLLDDLYADSALRALARISPSQSHDLLTPDRSSALRRLIVAAAAEVAAALIRRLLSFSVPDPGGESDNDVIIFEIDDSIPLMPEAVRHHVTAAMTFAVLRLAALAAADDRRAKGFGTCLRKTLEALDPVPPSLRIRPAI